jgi:hypothetical protein
MKMAKQIRNKVLLTTQTGVSVKVSMRHYLSLVLAVSSIGGVAQASLQCPGQSIDAVLSGGDRTDPIRIRAYELMTMAGRWKITDDGLMLIDINIVKVGKHGSKVRLTFHHYDTKTATWATQVSENVEYVKGKAIFHFAKNAADELSDIVLAAFTDKAKSQQTVVVSISRCDGRGKKIRNFHPTEPMFLRPVVGR